MLKTRWNIECHDKDGNLKWSEYDLPNLLHDEGEQAILSAYFDTDLSGFGAPPANVYVGLRAASPAIAEADTLTTIANSGSNGELAVASGYARSALSTTSGFTLSQVSDAYRATSGSVVFTASGTWVAATALFLATTSSGTAGKLLCSVALGAIRTLASGETLTVSLYVGLSE